MRARAEGGWAVGWRTRSFVSLVLVFFLAGTVAPAGAWGAVTLTWERDWGSDGSADGQFHYPSDVAADKWGYVYVAGGENGDNRVQMFNANGGFIKSVTVADSKPRAVATDRWGTVYVAEKGLGATIRLYNPRLYSQIGTVQESADEIFNPLNVAVALDGTLYCAENGLAIQRWRYRGFSGQWSPLGTMTVGLGVSDDGVVLTTTDITAGIIQSVITYDPAGAYLDDWGGFGTGPGQFKRPYDVGSDPQGNVYVVESEGSRGQVFAPDGAYLTTFGSSGTGNGQFLSPYGIAVGRDRTVYVVSQVLHRVSKWNVSVPTRSAQVSGTDRIKTAIAAAEKAYPDGAMTVVLATASNWPDALGGAALAGTVKGPLLLTYKDSLPAEVAAEIVKLKARHVYVLGGTAAVSNKVYTDAVKLTIDKSGARLWGSNRYLTANDIAEEVIALKNMPGGGGYDGTAFVCTGADFPDALAVAPVAAANGWPIFLTEPNRLTPSVEAAMKADDVSHGYLTAGSSAFSPPMR
jgi:DNA-binding beta-propeller fold protein YncE